MSKLSQEIKEYISCPQINGKPYGRWGALNSQQKIKIWNLAHQCEVFESVADESVKKLFKYEKAFEILKEKFSLDKTEIFGNGNLYFLNGIDSCWEISQEEYELLEELMKSE